MFDGSVSGLRTGGAVLFNGIRVGEVTGLKLDPDKPQQVIATVSVDKTVAIRPDVQIGLEFQGLTGIASIALKGGSVDEPALVGSKDNPPALTAPPNATADITRPRARRCAGSTSSSSTIRKPSTTRSPISTSSAPRWRAIPSASTRSPPACRT